MIYEQESKELLRLALLLHREMGCGFKEKVYQDAFEVLLLENKIPYDREKHLTITYHGIQLEHDFYYDFLLWDKIGVEIKAFTEIVTEFDSQLINYLHVSNHKLGIILNFGSKSLQYKWIPNIWDHRATTNIG